MTPLGWFPDKQSVTPHVADRQRALADFGQILKTDKFPDGKTGQQ